MRAVLAATMLIGSISAGTAMAQQSSRKPGHHQHKQQVVKPVKSHPRVTTSVRWPPESLVPPPLIVVAYEEGALSVVAEDATLREVFDRLHESTGAAVEAPAMEQRISVHLGPQPPVQTIAALLEGTHLSYAILGGTGRGDPIRRIIVMPKPAGSPSAPSPHTEQAAARTRAGMNRAETGGTEGMWDDKEAESPTQAPVSSPRQRDRAHK